MSLHVPVLQQYAEGADDSSSAQAGNLARTTTRARSKSSSPSAPPLPPISESTSASNSMGLPETDFDTDRFTEDGEDGDDILSIQHVTISRTTRARNEEQPVALPDHDLLSPEERQGLHSKEGTQKKCHLHYWSKEECDTLIRLCSGNTEAQREPVRGPVTAFWTRVQAQLPGRSPSGCYQKWIKLRGRSKKNKEKKEKKKKRKTAARHVDVRRWSPEELLKLEQLRPPPGKPVDWVKLASHFPGRSKSACFNKLGRKGRMPTSIPQDSA